MSAKNIFRQKIGLKERIRRFRTTQQALIAVRARQQQERDAALNVGTYWNGEQAKCERVRVIVGKSPDTWWCSSLEGAEREAVRVEYNGDTFYLDNDAGVDLFGNKWPAGMGWHKVTVACGYPDFPHRSVPAAREVTR